jgi:hypothetical protein
MNRYVDRVVRAGLHDDDVAIRFNEVAALVRRPESLLAPGFVLRVLRAARHTGASKSEVHLPGHPRWPGSERPDRRGGADGPTSAAPHACALRRFGTASGTTVDPPPHHVTPQGRQGLTLLHGRCGSARAR